MKRLFQVGHTYYRRDDGAIMLTDDDRQEFHQVCLDKSITISDGHFSIPLVDDRVTVGSATEVERLVAEFGMQLRIGLTRFRAVEE